MPTKLDEWEQNGDRWFMLIVTGALVAWCVFIWLSWRMVSPYVADFAVAAGLSLILGFLGVCAAIFVCMFIVMLAAIFIVPKRRQSEAR